MANFDAARYLCQWSRLVKTVQMPGRARRGPSPRRPPAASSSSTRATARSRASSSTATPSRGLHLTLPLISCGGHLSSDALPFPHSPGVFDWPNNVYLPVMLPELTFGDHVTLPAFYGKNCVTGLGMRNSFFFRYEQPDLITTKEEMVKNLGSVKVQWNFSGKKVACEFAYTVKQQVTLDKFRYVLVVAAPHSQVPRAGLPRPRAPRPPLQRRQGRLPGHLAGHRGGHAPIRPTARTSGRSITCSTSSATIRSSCGRAMSTAWRSISSRTCVRRRRLMLSRRIIPCLDVTAGRVVKGVRFKELRDAGDPVECAAAYDAQGADELVFLDITASSDRRRIMHDVVAATAERCFMPLTVGGGLRTADDIEAMLRSGADKVSLNTSAIAEPRADRRGLRPLRLPVHRPGDRRQARARPRAALAGVHARRAQPDRARRRRMGRARRVELGAGEILLTSMDRDGTQAGYDLELTRRVSDAVAVPVIASGGAGRLEDFAEVLGPGGASAALAASLFHFGALTVPGVKRFLAQRGVPVRI